MIRHFFLVLLCALSASAFAQNKAAAGNAPQGDLPVRKQIDDFFAAIENHQIDTAYDQLTKGTKIAERSTEVSTLKSKTQQAVQLFGDVQGHEMVDVKTVGTHLLRAIYLSLGRDFPLRWRFYYYRIGETWRLIDIRVDDRLADVFGETTPPEPAENPAKP